MCKAPLKPQESITKNLLKIPADHCSTCDAKLRLIHHVATSDVQHELFFEAKSEFFEIVTPAASLIDYYHVLRGLFMASICEIKRTGKKRMMHYYSVAPRANVAVARIILYDTLNADQRHKAYSFIMTTLKSIANSQSQESLNTHH